MHHRNLIFLALATLAVAACNKDGGANDTAGNDDDAQASGLLDKVVGKVKKEQAQAAIPQPDSKVPLSSYRKLGDKNADAMFLYQAVSSLPPDYEKLAQGFSKEFRETSDSFRKQELLAALQPQMEQQITQAKASPYGYITLNYNNNLESYDFQRKGFPVFSFGENTQQERLGDYNSGKALNWVNRSQVAFAPVADEAAARVIEGMRTKGRYNNPPLLNVYFFAQSANLNSDEINAVVTHVQITDKSGRVLAEYGPDGSVLPAESASGNSNGNGIDAAADAAAALMGGSP